MLGGLAGHERKGGRFQTGHEVYDPDGISPTVLSHGGGYGIMVIEEQTRAKRLGNIYGEDKGTSFAGNVWDKEALSPTITTMQGGAESL